MRRYRKWVLTLGIVAVTPGLAAAAPFAFGQPKDDVTPARCGPGLKSKNQKVAEDIALALKKASFPRLRNRHRISKMAWPLFAVRSPTRGKRPVPARSSRKFPASAASKTS